MPGRMMRLMAQWSCSNDPSSRYIETLAFQAQRLGLQGRVVASRLTHVAQMTGQDMMRACFQAVTETTARLLGLENYGLSRGCDADLMILDSGNTVEAIRLRAARRYVIRRGDVVSQTPTVKAALSLPGRPRNVDFRWRC